MLQVHAAEAECSLLCTIPVLSGDTLLDILRSWVKYVPGQLWRGDHHVCTRRTIGLEDWPVLLGVLCMQDLAALLLQLQHAAGRT